MRKETTIMLGALCMACASTPLSAGDAPMSTAEKKELSSPMEKTMVADNLDQHKFPSLIQNAAKWAQGKLGDSSYRGKCLAFVEDAYEQSNGIEMYGGSTATESAAMYGCVMEGEPPLGALVFFATTGTLDGKLRNYGHVGIHLGDGKLIHAWDVVRIDDYRRFPDLLDAPGWSKLVYLGWVPPERFLRDGHKRDWGRKK